MVPNDDVPYTYCPACGSRGTVSGTPPWCSSCAWGGQDAAAALTAHLLDRLSLAPVPPPAARKRARPIKHAVMLYVGMTVDEAEQALVEATVAQCQDNKSAAALMLGMSRRSLYNKLAIYARAKKKKAVTK